MSFLGVQTSAVPSCYSPTDRLVCVMQIPPQKSLLLIILWIFYKLFAPVSFRANDHTVLFKSRLKKDITLSCIHPSKVFKLE